MRMLMRIEVGRRMSEQGLEERELAIKFGSNSFGVLWIDHLIDNLPIPVLKPPFGQIKVQADAQPWMCPGIVGRLPCPSVANHETGAG